MRTKQEGKKRPTQTPPKQFLKIAKRIYLLIIILNVNRLNPQFKDREWLTDTKTRPIYIYAAYRLTSDVMT